jgi:hypothetical protein
VRCYKALSIAEELRTEGNYALEVETLQLGMKRGEERRGEQSSREPLTYIGVVPLHNTYAIVLVLYRNYEINLVLHRSVPYIVT